MSQPMDPWAQLRHQAEERERLLRHRRHQHDPRTTIRNPKAGAAG